MKILVLWLGMHSTVYVRGVAFRPTPGIIRRWTDLEPGKGGSGLIWSRPGTAPPRLPWAVPTASNWGLMVPLPPPCIGCGKMPGNDGMKFPTEVGLRPKFKPGGLNSR
jgi:hypothetical protein